MALKSEFSVDNKHYPGLRTERRSGILSALSDALRQNDFDPRVPDDTYSGTFQAVMEGTDTWVHRDSYNVRAAVIFLTPDEIWQAAQRRHNEIHGTGFYRHEPSGQWWGDDPVDWNEEPLVPADWTCWREVQGRFNRAVFFNSALYHRSVLPGFGTTLQDCRLTQVIFF